MGCYKPDKQTPWTRATRRNTRSMISMTGSSRVDSTFRILFLFSKFCDEICFYVHIIAFRANIGKLLFPCFILLHTFSPILSLSCYYILFYPIMHTTKVALNIFTDTNIINTRNKGFLHIHISSKTTIFISCSKEWKFIEFKIWINQYV